MWMSHIEYGTKTLLFSVEFRYHFESPLGGQKPVILVEAKVIRGDQKSVSDLEHDFSWILHWEQEACHFGEGKGYSR